VTYPIDSVAFKADKHLLGCVCRR